MEQYIQNGIQQFFEIILFPTFLWIFILLTCAKPRRPKTDSNSSNIGKQPRIERQKGTTPSNYNNTTKTAKTENTREMASAPSVSGTPQMQSDMKADTSNRQKKAIKTSKQNNKTSKKSKREKTTKEEKTKRESNLKKFFHKFGGGNSEKTKSFEEALDGHNNNNGAGGGDENEKLPLSSRKGRRRKMIGDQNNNLLKTAEDENQNNNPVEEEPKIVDPVKVVQMGNIDLITQQEKHKRIREIEQMPSGNYCEEPTQLSKSLKKENMHVKIVEANCKLYETNAEPMTKSLRESMRKRKKIKHQLRPRSRGSDTK